MTGAPTWGPTRRGPRPSTRTAGGDAPDPAAIAADLTAWWAECLPTLPDGPFPLPDWLRATMLDSAIRRGWIERRGLDAEGRAWTYATTALGAAVVAVLRRGRPSPSDGPASRPPPSHPSPNP